MKKENDNIKSVVNVLPRPPYYSDRRRSLLIAFTFSVIAFILSLYWGINLIYKKGEVSVLIAASDLSAPHTISDKDFISINVPREIVPSGALKNIKDTGNKKTLYYPMSKGQILTETQLKENSGQSDTIINLGGSSITSGFKGIILPSSWFINPIPKVKINDTISIIFTYKDNDLESFKTKYIEKKIKIISVQEQGNERIESIMAEVDDETLKDIIEKRLSKFNLSIVLNSTR